MLDHDGRQVRIHGDGDLCLAKVPESRLHVAIAVLCAEGIAAESTIRVHSHADPIATIEIRADEAERAQAVLDSIE